MKRHRNKWTEARRAKFTATMRAKRALAADVKSERPTTLAAAGRALWAKRAAPSRRRNPKYVYVLNKDGTFTRRRLVVTRVTTYSLERT